MHWYRGRCVLVTGASGSVGGALSRHLALLEARLILSGRSAERLAAVAADCRAAGAEVHLYALDLAREGAAAALVERLAAAGHTIDVLINNAGFAKAGPFLEHPADDYEEMVRVNITSLVALTRGLLPGMCARRTGGVLNVASVSGFLPVPQLAVYAATKAFVQRFSEALHHEVKPHGVHVTCVAPGAVASESFLDRATMARPAGPVAPLKASRVARASLRALARNKRLVSVGPFDRLVEAGARLAPKRLQLALGQRFVQDARRPRGS